MTGLSSNVSSRRRLGNLRCRPPVCQLRLGRIRGPRMRIPVVTLTALIALLLFADDPGRAGAAEDRRAAVSVAKVDVSPSIRAIVDAPDRSAEDRALDGGRHPAEMLAFFGVKPGTKAAELGAGGGYTAEPLACAVGPTGVVYAQNNKFI